MAENEKVKQEAHFSVRFRKFVKPVFESEMENVISNLLFYNNIIMSLAYEFFNLARYQRFQIYYKSNRFA